jgi:hypothetical protein
MHFVFYHMNCCNLEYALFFVFVPLNSSHTIDRKQNASVTSHIIERPTRNVSSFVFKDQSFSYQSYVTAGIACPDI